jgi:hypothetical protein
MSKISTSFQPKSRLGIQSKTSAPESSLRSSAELNRRPYALANRTSRQTDIFAPSSVMKPVCDTVVVKSPSTYQSTGFLLETRHVRHEQQSSPEEVMNDDRTVLAIGLDPTLIDFSQPGYQPGMSAEKVFAGLKASENEMAALGYKMEMCLTDFGETAESVVQKCLEQKQYDCIMIGAGVRANPNNLLLFEKLINVVHSHAPNSKICFNTLPSDTAEAIQRWV